MKLSLIAASALLLSVGCASKVAPGFAECDTSPATSCKSDNVWAQVCSPWVLATPKVHLIFWGSWWITSNQSEQSNQLSQEWQILANDPNFYLPMAQYGVGAGSLDGIFYSDPGLPNTSIAYKDIETELQSEIDNNELPAADNNSIYVLMLPPDTQAAYDDDGKFSGYHGHVGFYTYAVIEYGSNNFMSYTMSHEIAEASTNPDTVSGYWAGGGETEIADNCYPKSYTLDGYSITQLWNQDSCSCGPQ